LARPSSARLSPRLEAVLARLCTRLGPLLTTRAVKLPYLIDVLAQHHLGAPITGGTHQTWDYGVVTAEVWSYIQKNGDGNGPFEVSEHRFSEGGKQICLAREMEKNILKPEEEAIVDYVAENYGAVDATSLGKLTKALNTQLDVRAWGKNHAASVDEDAYARLSRSYQAFANRLPDLDLKNEESWGEPIGDPRDYLRRALGG